MFAVQDTEIYMSAVETLDSSIRTQLAISGLEPVRTVWRCIIRDAMELRSELCQNCQILMCGADSAERLLRACASERGCSMLMVLRHVCISRTSFPSSIATDPLEFGFGGGISKEALLGHASGQ